MIVILYPELSGVGGIARYIEALLLNAPSDTQIVVLTSRDERLPPRIGPAQIVQLKKPPGRLGLLHWTLSARRWLKRFEQAHPVSTLNLHVPPLIPGLLLPARGLNVVTAHTTYRGMASVHGGDSSPRQWSRSSVIAKLWMERRIFRRADRMITLTKQGQQELAAYRTAAPVTIIPNGVDTSIFSPRDAKKNTDVVFVGRLEQRKGSRALPAVVARLLELRPTSTITIAGYGDDEAFVREALRRAQGVTFLGKIDFSSVPALLARSRVYASTSFYEGLPGSCMEAMAMEVPPVVWDLPFYDDLVEHGATGVRVPLSDHDAFAKAVLDLLQNGDKRRRIGCTAAAHVAEHYSWRKLSPRILRILAPRDLDAKR